MQDVPAGTHVLGFDFYGAGNIGDDIMLGGFLSSLPGARLVGHCHDLESQRLRFPQVSWLDPKGEDSEALPQEVLRRGGAWLGVGDTPFQISSGPWFLHKLAAAARELRPGVPMLMVGVGAERKVTALRATVRPVLDRVDQIWARDAKSAQLLVDWGASPDRVHVAADLAHAFLGKRAGVASSARPYALAVNFYSERRMPLSLAALRTFIARRNAVAPVLLMATDDRPQMEAALFSKLSRSRSWGGLGSGPGLAQPASLPNYRTGSMEELIAPFAEVETLLSSRYHAIICAAWSGCRIGVLGGRSSKLDDLAEDLRLPILKPPYSLRALDRLLHEAVAVDFQRLRACQASAELSAVQAMLYAEHALSAPAKRL